MKVSLTEFVVAIDYLNEAFPLPYHPSDSVISLQFRQAAASATIRYLMKMLSCRQLLGNYRCIPSFPRQLIPSQPLVFVVHPDGYCQLGVPTSLAGRVKAFLYNFYHGEIVADDVSSVGYNEALSPIANVNLDQTIVHVNASMTYALYAKYFLWSVTMNMR